MRIQFVHINFPPINEINPKLGPFLTRYRERLSVRELDKKFVAFSEPQNQIKNKKMSYRIKIDLMSGDCNNTYQFEGN